MPGILDNLNCGEFMEGDRRNSIAAGVAGALFFAGWWIIIDVGSDPLQRENFNGAYYVCGITGTLALIMINAVSNGQLRGDGYSQGCMGPRGARTWLFMGFVLGFVSVIASGWILIAGYVANSKVTAVWPGVAVFLHNILIFVSSLTYKFGRSEDLWG